MKSSVQIIVIFAQLVYARASNKFYILAFCVNVMWLLRWESLQQYLVYYMRKVECCYVVFWWVFLYFSYHDFSRNRRLTKTLLFVTQGELLNHWSQNGKNESSLSNKVSLLIISYDISDLCEICVNLAKTKAWTFWVHS